MKSSYNAILAVLLAGCAVANAQTAPDGFLLSNFTVKANGAYVFKVVTKWSEAVTGLEKTDFQIEILKNGGVAETWSDGLNIETITSNPDGSSYVITVDISSLLAGAADDARVTLFANSVTSVASGVTAPAEDLISALVMPNDDAATEFDDYFSLMGDTYQPADDETFQNDPYSLMDDQFEIPGQTDDDFVDEPPANFTGNLTEPTPSDATEPVDAHTQTTVTVSDAPPDSTEFSNTQPDSDNVTFSDANAPTNDDAEDGAPPANATTEIPNDSTITSGTDADPFGGNQTEPSPSDDFMATIPENETVTSGPQDDVNRPDDDGATPPPDTFDDEPTTLYDDAVPSNGPVMGGNETTEPEPEPSFIPAPSNSPMPEPSGSVPPQPSDDPVNTSADDEHITTGDVVMGDDITSGTDSPLKNDVPSTNPWDDSGTGSDMPPPLDDGGSGSTAPGFEDGSSGAQGFDDNSATTSGSGEPPKAWDDDVPVAASGVPSPTASVTPRPTPSETPSTTATALPTPSPTGTSKPTQSATATPTSTNSAKPTPSSTGTPTPSATSAPTQTATPTPSITQSSGATPSVTPSHTPTNSAESTTTATSSPTGTPTPSSTTSASVTPSMTPSTTSVQTMTATPTVSLSRTPSHTPTPTMTPASTSTATAEPSVMPSKAATPTPSQTASVTSVPTLTASPTSTISVTPTVSLTSTPTPTSTVSVTASPTSTVSITASPTATPSVSLSSTPAPSRKPDPCMGFDCGHGSCSPSASDPLLPECTCTTLRYAKLALTGQCIVDKCENGKHDEGEADVDCGGHCNALCSAGELCLTTGDCGIDPSSELDNTRLVCTANYLVLTTPQDDVAIVSSSSFVEGSVSEDEKPRCRSGSVEVGVHVETSFILPGVTLAALSDSVLSTVVEVVKAGVEGAQQVEVVSLAAVEGLDAAVYGSEFGSRVGVSVRFNEEDSDMAKANVESYFDSLLASASASASASADPNASGSSAAVSAEADLVGSVNAELPADQQMATFAGAEFVQPPVSVAESVNRCGKEGAACVAASVTPMPTTTPTPSATPSRDPDVTPSASPSEWANNNNNNDDLFGGIGPGGDRSSGDEGGSQTTVIVAAVAATLGVVGIGFLGYKWFSRGSGTAVRGRYRTTATPAGNKRLAAALRRIPMPSANAGGDSMSFSPSSGYDVRQAPSSPSAEGLRHAGGANSPMAMLGGGGNSPSATNPMLSHLEMPMRQAPQGNMRRGFQPNAANV